MWRESKTITCQTQSFHSTGPEWLYCSVCITTKMVCGATSGSMSAFFVGDQSASDKSASNKSSGLGGLNLASVGLAESCAELVRRAGADLAVADKPGGVEIPRFKG